MKDNENRSTVGEVMGKSRASCFLTHMRHPCHDGCRTVADDSFVRLLQKVLFKIFGAMSKDFYRYIWECFSTDPVEPVNTKTSGQVQ